MHIKNQEFYSPYFEKPIFRIPAKVISILFHPIFVTFLTSLLIYRLQREQYVSIRNAHPLWIWTLLLNLVFFPIAATVLLRALGFISSFVMKEPKDRIIPLMATMIFYFWAFNVFKNINAPLNMQIYLLGSFFGVIMIFMINIFFKISMHTTAIGATVGILTIMALSLRIDLMPLIFLSIFINGIIGTARLILKAHIPFELILGYIVGVLVQVVAYFIMK